MRKAFVLLFSSLLLFSFTGVASDAQATPSFVDWVPSSQSGANLRVLDSIYITGVGAKNLLFLVDGPSGARELWKTDGTESGTFKVKELIASGAKYDRNTTYSNACGGVAVTQLGMFFGVALEPSATLRCQLWRTDGTAGGSSKIGEFDSIFDITPVGTGILMQATHADFGGEALVSYQGGGFQIIKPANVWVSQISSIGWKAVFMAAEGLWVTDGTTAGTALLLELSSRGRTSSFGRYQGGVGFVVQRYPAGYIDPPSGPGPRDYFEFYTSDGTVGGTKLQYTFVRPNTSSYSETRSPGICRAGGGLALLIPETGAGNIAMNSIYLFKDSTVSKIWNDPAVQYTSPVAEMDNYCLVFYRTSFSDEGLTVSGQGVVAQTRVIDLYSDWWGGRSSSPLLVGDSAFSMVKGTQYDTASIRVTEVADAFKARNVVAEILAPFEPAALALFNQDLFSFEEMSGQVQIRKMTSDQCPLDYSKRVPAQCGCGTPDIDLDRDGVASCIDLCPTDSEKTSPGQCDCGMRDTDSDYDGLANCKDACPFDAKKSSSIGQCGCGVAEIDKDGDGVATCIDACDLDPKKIARGLCGCGVSDLDSDGDTVPDCTDACSLDPLKTSPGVCNCGVPDVDTDGDGTLDCKDFCPANKAKLSPGICGCEIADVDTDQDGTPNCKDLCPNDPRKTAPGQQGCGRVEIEEPTKATPTPTPFAASCPSGSLKKEPGLCGCESLDRDSNSNGVVDCLEPSLTTPPNKAKVVLRGVKVTVEMSKFDGVTYLLTFLQGKTKRLLRSESPVVALESLKPGKWSLTYKIQLVGTSQQTPSSAAAKFSVATRKLRR